MKTRAEIIADRLDEMGRIKDMGRPAILDTEREAAEIIRFMQRRIDELEEENAFLNKGATLWRLRLETVRYLYPSAPSDYELDAAIGAAMQKNN